MVAVALLSLLGTLRTVVWSTTASVAGDEAAHRASKEAEVAKLSEARAIDEAVAALLASKAEVAKLKLQVEEVRPRDHHRPSPVAPPPLWDKSDPRQRVLFLQYDTREFSSPLGSERPDKFKPCVSRQSKYDYKIGFWAQSALINQFYCDLHGFDYLYVVPTIGVPPSTAGGGYHPSWWRTWVLPEVMRRYPTHRWIFVLDPDAFVEQVDLHLFDFLNQASVRPASFIAAFYSKDGAGAGELVLRNDAAAIDLVEQWQTVVERGECEERYRQEISLEQTCVKYLFQSNASLHDSGTVSKQPMGFMTDRFVRHCGGGGKQPCIDRGVYANALQRLSIDVEEAKVRWARIERDSLLRLEKPPEVWAEDYPVLTMGYPPAAMRGAAGAEQPPRVLLPTKAKKRELRFVHIPKNTGTFVEHLGKAHPGAVAGWGMNDPDLRLLEPEWGRDAAGHRTYCNPWHMPARELLRRGAAQAGSRQYFERFDTFAIVRDPQERARSEIRRQRAGYDFGAALAQHRAWLAERRGSKPPHDCHLFPQAWYVYDERGEQVVTHVLWYGERLAEDFDALMAQYELPVRWGDIEGRIQWNGAKATSRSDAEVERSDGFLGGAEFAEFYAEDYERFGFTPRQSVEI